VAALLIDLARAADPVGELECRVPGPIRRLGIANSERHTILLEAEIERGVERGVEDRDALGAHLHVLVRQLLNLLRDRLLLRSEIRGDGSHRWHAARRDVELEAELRGESSEVKVPAQGGEAGRTIEPHFSVPKPRTSSLCPLERGSTRVCGPQSDLPVCLDHELLLGDAQLDVTVLLLLGKRPIFVIVKLRGFFHKLGVVKIVVRREVGVQV